MDLNELRDFKRYLGYSNKMLAERAGLPLGTVQKVLSGETKAPRYATIKALEKAVYEGYNERLEAEGYDLEEFGISYVTDGGLAHDYSYETETGDRTESADGIVHGGPDIIEDAWSGNWRRQGTYTIEDYEAIPDEVRVELIDGVIYNMGAPTSMHQELLGELFVIFKLFMKTKKGKRKCNVFMAPCDVKLLIDDEKTIVQPDLLIVCDKKKKDMYKRINGGPRFVVEILSPSNLEKDMIKKAGKYLDAGVEEYWMVDPKNEEVIVHDFAGSNIYMRYSFADKIPVRIFDGELVVDFAEIREDLVETFGENFNSEE